MILILFHPLLNFVYPSLDYNLPLSIFPAPVLFIFISFLPIMFAFPHLSNFRSCYIYPTFFPSFLPSFFYSSHSLLSSTYFQSTYNLLLTRGDSMSRFHNALFLGDAEERVKVLESTNQLSLAYITAATHGLIDSSERYHSILVRIEFFLWK